MTILEEAKRNASMRFTNWVSSLLPAFAEDGKPDPVREPMASYRYLWNRREAIIAGGRQRPLIRIGDKNLDVLMELNHEITLSWEELAHDTGSARISIRYDNHLVDWMVHQTKVMEDLHLLIDPNPTKPDWRTRWGGKITEIHLLRDEQGIHTIEIYAVSHREHAKRLLFAANPIFAPEVQLPKMWILPGPTRSVLSASMFINLARVFFPPLSVIGNLFNPAGWINPLNTGGLRNFLPMNWPLQVAFVNPLLDQSRWTTLGATWTDWHSSMGDILKDSGCVFRAYTWLTTDEDSPHTELTDLIKAGPQFLKFMGIDLDGLDGSRLAALSRPNRNCVVFAVEDHDGITGPTGTVVDGALNLIGVTLDNLITPIVINLDNGGIIDAGQTLHGQPIEDASGYDRSYLMSKLLGVAPEPPKVIWWRGEYEGASSTDLTWHKGGVKTIMTGGRSPTIVNQAQTFAIRYGLAQLSQVINMWLANVSGQTQLPGSPGLDNLYQGQLDNVLFAWQRFTDPIRARQSGDMAWQEHFERGGGTAYVLASALTLRMGNWKTRPYTSFKARTVNGHPWLADVDFRLGDRLGFEEELVIYVDQLNGIKREYGPGRPLTLTLAIGDDRDRDDPFNAAFKTMAAVWSLLGAFLGEGTIFG